MPKKPSAPEASGPAQPPSQPNAPRRRAPAADASPPPAAKSKVKPPRTSKPKSDDRTAATKPTRRKAERPAIQRRESLAQRLLQTGRTVSAKLRDPSWRSRARSLFPSWVDEVIALLIIVLGVVMLTALLNTTSEARLAVTLSLRLRQFFGLGAFFVALGAVAAGIVLLLRKFGFHVRLGAAKVVALEAAFLAVLALLHVLADDPEPRVLAQQGGGGGYTGWVLTLLPLTKTPALILFGGLLLVAATVISDLRLGHLLRGMAWVRQHIQEYLNRQGAGPGTQPLLAERGGSRRLGGGSQSRSPGPRPSIVPRDSNAASAAEAVLTAGSARPRTPADGAPSSGNAGRTSAPPLRPRPSERPLTKAEKREIALRIRRQHGADNGRSLVAPGEPGARPSIVPDDLLAAAPGAGAAEPRARAAGPTAAERYFSVEDFQETRRVGKRDPRLPPLELLSDVELNKPTEEEINTNARIIKNTLLEFDVETEVIDVNVGPTVTQYAVSPFTHTLNEDGEWVLNRVRVNEIVRLNGDLALALSARRLRIQAPVPGHSYVGIEVPNRQPSTVALRPVLESEVFYRHRERPLALPLGRDVSGEAFVADLATMPHLLIAGTTGSGKSIMLAAMTTAFVMNNSPDRVKLILLDPKMVELMRFNGLPHLLGPVETELDRIIGVLRWSTREMDRRYKLLEKEAARNLDTYNRALGRRRKDEQLPYIVIIIDEIGDLMLQRPDETERTLTRLAQMARAVGMHLMVATQRPSVDVITGLIKANFPARISFAVASSIDSRVILDSVGAETLMGRGDMLYLAPDAAGPRRLQGCNITDEEVTAVVDYWHNWREQQIDEGRAELPPIPPWERGMTRREVLSETDPMLEEAITLIVEEGEASASLIQRRLGLGYPRAARIIDMMHELGIIGDAQPGGRTRDVLVKPGEDPFKRIIDGRLKRKSGGE